MSWNALLTQLQAAKVPCPEAYHKTADAPAGMVCKECGDTGQVQHPLARELYEALTEWDGTWTHEGLRGDQPGRKPLSDNGCLAAALDWCAKHKGMVIRYPDMNGKQRWLLSFDGDELDSEGISVPAALGAVLPALLGVKA